MTTSGDLSRIRIRYEWRLVKPTAFRTLTLAARQCVKHVHILSTGREIEFDLEFEVGSELAEGFFCWDCGALAPPLIKLQAILLAS